MRLIVITGGQTGADQAGWRAAKRFNIPTLGWMPKGFLTEEGQRPEFAAMYGAKEHSLPTYPPRTRMNAAYVADEAGAFLCFNAGPKVSAGTKLLMDVVADLRRRGFSPSLAIVNLRPEGAGWQLANAGCEPSWAAGALKARGDRRLMIAGNRESKAPGIGAFVEGYMREVFRILAEQEVPA